MAHFLLLLFSIVYDGQFHLFKLDSLVFHLKCFHFTEYSEGQKRGVAAGGVGGNTLGGGAGKYREYQNVEYKRVTYLSISECNHETRKQTMGLGPSQRIAL